MCCMMQVNTNYAPLMAEALTAWSRDTYHGHDKGGIGVPDYVPARYLKASGVNMTVSSATVTFSLNGVGHGTEPESWVAAVKGMTTLYNHGLAMNSAKQYRWKALQLGEPCDEQVVGECGLAIDLSLLCWAGAPMGLRKVEAMVVSDHHLAEDGCACGCDNDCGAEPRVREA